MKALQMPEHTEEQQTRLSEVYRSTKDDEMTPSKEDNKFEQVVQQIDPLVNDPKPGQLLP